MINVLHIVLGMQVGGLEKFVLDLIDKYPPQIKPFIVCLEGKGELGLQRKQLDIYELSKRQGISLDVIRQLIVFTKSHNIDLIHTHNPSPHFYGSIAGYLTGRPVVHTKHGRNFPKDTKRVWINKLASFLTDRVVAVSHDAATVCLDVEKIPSSKVSVILNGTDTNLFFPARDKIFDRRMPLRIGIVARLSAEKDHVTLLNACKLLANRTNNFHLDVIGGGVLRETLEQTVEALGICPFVTFYGVCHNVPELLRKLDIFVLSSTTEGISLTLLEAMASELPIVATNVGGNPEVVIEGETGYLVPPQNSEEIATKLLCLINDGDLRRQMGVRGRERVISHFSIEETAKKYADLYCSVLTKRWR